MLSISIMKVSFLALIALISSAGAQKSCSASSPQCCWVIRVWQLMGKNPSAKSSKKGNDDCCSMPGVVCAGSKVTELLWASQGLTGSIPYDIGNLRDLNTLLLNDNHLTGWIPDSIGQLTKMKVIQLHRNQLTGPIPGTIGNMRDVFSFYLYNNYLTGSIPASIGDMTKMRWLILNDNQLSGPLPSTIENLNNLDMLYLYNNPGLSGTVSAPCKAIVEVDNTLITLCGCSSASNPASIFPSSWTPGVCLSSRRSSSLMKKSPTFSEHVDGLKFTCNVDDYNNPSQDCLNSMAYLCHPTHTASNPSIAARCRNAVDQMVHHMNYHWQVVRMECGQWPWYGVRGSMTSSRCASANAALQANAYYIAPDGRRIPITPLLTNSINWGLWNNGALNR